MKRLVLASLLSAVASLSAQADVITQWTFEGDVLTPGTGSGAAAYVGGTAAAARENSLPEIWTGLEYVELSHAGCRVGHCGREFSCQHAGLPEHPDQL